MLDRLIGHGRLYDAFCARLFVTRPDSAPEVEGEQVELELPVVAKLVDFDTFPTLPGSTTHKTTFDLSQAKKAVMNEIEVLCGPLAPLQGVVVPRLIGVWSCPPGMRNGRWARETRGAVMVVLEDVGDCAELSLEEESGFSPMVK